MESQMYAFFRPCPGMLSFKLCMHHMVPLILILCRISLPFFVGVAGPNQATLGAVPYQATWGAVPYQATLGAVPYQATWGAVAYQATLGAVPYQPTLGAGTLEDLDWVWPHVALQHGGSNAWVEEFQI